MRTLLAKTALSIFLACAGLSVFAFGEETLSNQTSLDIPNGDSSILINYRLRGKELAYAVFQEGKGRIVSHVLGSDKDDWLIHKGRRIHLGSEKDNCFSVKGDDLVSRRIRISAEDWQAFVNSPEADKGYAGFIRFLSAHSNH